MGGLLEGLPDHSLGAGLVVRLGTALDLAGHVRVDVVLRDPDRLALVHARVAADRRVERDVSADHQVDEELDDFVALERALDGSDAEANGTVHSLVEHLGLALLGSRDAGEREDDPPHAFFGRDHHVGHLLEVLSGAEAGMLGTEDVADDLVEELAHELAARERVEHRLRHTLAQRELAFHDSFFSLS